MWRHNGIISLDIDENNYQALAEFLYGIYGVPFIEAAALSVSGIHSGALWANVRIEIPERLNDTPPEVVKLINECISKRILDAGQFAEGREYIENAETLHKAYHFALTRFFKRNYDINVGGSKDLKRARYLSHDPEIFVNGDADVYLLTMLADELKTALDEHKHRTPSTTETVENAEKYTHNIFTDNPFVFAERKAIEYCGKPKISGGNRQSFAFAFARACILLGVPQHEAEAFFIKKFSGKEYKGSRVIKNGRIATDAFSSPYRAYAKDAGVWWYMLTKKERTPDTVIEHNAYIDELSENETFTSVLSAHKRILIQANTGSGKTTWATRQGIRWHEQEQSITVIALPLNAIVKQKGQQTEKEHGQYLSYITGENLRNELWYWDNSPTPVIYVNYDNTSAVCRHLARQNVAYNLIIDEQHELVNSYGYRGAAVMGVQAAMREARRIITMSATPFLAGFDDFHYIKIKSDAPQIKGRIRLTKSLLEGLMSELIPNLGHKQQIVLFNSKKRLRKAHKAIQKMGYNAAVIYSDVSLKDNETYKHICEHSELPHDIDVLLCTSKIATGIDLKLTRETKFIYVENSLFDGYKVGYNKRLKEQFKGRARNADMISEFVILAPDRKHKTSNKTANQVFAEKNRYWTGFADMLNKSEFQHIDTQHTEKTPITARNGFSDVVNCVSVIDGKAEVNRLALAYLSLNHEIKNGCLAAIYTDTQNDTHTHTLTDAEADAIKRAEKEVNDTTAFIHETAYKELSKPETRTIAANKVHNRTQSAGLIKSIKLRFERLPDVGDFTPYVHSIYEKMFAVIFRFMAFKMSFADAYDIVCDHKRQCLRSPQQINHRFNQLSVQSLLSGDNEGALTKRQAAKYERIRNDLNKAFVMNDGKLNRKQIHAAVKKHYKNPISYTQAANLMLCLFDAKERQSGTGSRVKCFTLVRAWTYETLRAHFTENGARNFITISITKKKKNRASSGYDNQRVMQFVRQRRKRKNSSEKTTV